MRNENKTCWSDYRHLLKWKLTETLFHHQTNKPIGIKDKIIPRGISIPEYCLHLANLVGLTQKNNILGVIAHNFNNFGIWGIMKVVVTIDFQYPFNLFGYSL